MMWNGGGGYWGAGGWIGLFFMILFAVAVVVAIVFLVRYLTQGTTGSQTHATPPTAYGSGPEPPKEILKRRYAAGEIDRDEYLQKLGDL
jgi:putative membrane protein